MTKNADGKRPEIQAEADRVIHHSLCRRRHSSSSSGSDSDHSSRRSNKKTKKSEVERLAEIERQR